jgi:DNA-binding NtrC family response regulator
LNGEPHRLRVGGQSTERVSARQDTPGCQPDLAAPPENLLRIVKENEVHVVVIAVCVRAKLDDAIRATRESASDFILKPINLVELEIKLDKGIELKGLSQEGQALRSDRGPARSCGRQIL